MTSTDEKVDRLTLLLDVAKACASKGDLDGAEAMLLEALTIAQTLPKQDPALSKLPKFRSGS